MDIKRFYRDNIKSEKLVFFKASVQQTDLYIGASRELSQAAVDSIRFYRKQIEDYIRICPEFLHSLTPISAQKDAPLIVMDMCHAASLANVGPMASVAGAISKHVGHDLEKLSEEIIIENGGDIYIRSLHERTVGIYAGKSVLSGKLGIKISKNLFPCGICTSSGKVGHSLSFGNADAAIIVSKDAALADACATSLGNKVKNEHDIEDALDYISSIPGVFGAVVIIGEFLGVKGEIELTGI